MSHASISTHHQSVHYFDAIEGFEVPVTVCGPDNGRIVVMLDATTQESDAYDMVRERLHLAMFRTVVIPTDGSLSPKSTIDILDRLKVPGGLLVGDGAGGELAWLLAAIQRERFTGLVTVDVGHPRAPDKSGVIRDEHCAAVEVDTTVLVSTRATQAVARASRRFVHGEFRLAELAGPRKSRHFTTQLAAEIVLRSFSR